MYGDSPLIRASEYFTIKLIESGSDMHICDESGDSALHKAVRNGCITVSESLIENGADLNSQNHSGKTPLHIACQHGLVDEIFMLLFYGADSSITTSSGNNALDIAARQTSDVMHKVFDCLARHVKTLNISTLMFAIQDDRFRFPELLENTVNVAYKMDDLKAFSRTIILVNPHYFKLFIEKFDHFMEEILCGCNIANIFNLKDKTGCNLQNYVENLYTLFESNLSSQVVETIKRNRFCAIYYVISSCFAADKAVETVTKLISCMLSYGVDLHLDEIVAIYNIYGYCELFKLMLHMDIQKSKPFRYNANAIVPYIIYDINLTIERYLDDVDDFGYSLDSWIKAFSYFRSPKLRNLYLNLSSEGPSYICPQYSSIRTKVENLPTVPSLLELARNCSRTYIINQFKTKNCVQFYTVLKRLPIAQAHKEIIGFEREVYSF